MKYFSLIFLLFLSFQSHAQSGLVAHFTFDQCGEVVDETGINNSAFPDDGSPTFEDKIFLIGNYDNYFDDDDFTISMFFKVTDYNGNRTLLSKMADCDSDNGISIN